MDVTCVDPVTGKKWDLSNPIELMRFWKLRKVRRSRLLIASPPCRLFSVLQNLRKTPVPAEEYEQAVNMFKTVVEACKKQHSEGSFFVLEHPRGAKSWQVPEAQELMNMKGVYVITLDQCQFGQICTD